VNDSAAIDRRGKRNIDHGLTFWTPKHQTFSQSASHILQSSRDVLGLAFLRVFAGFSPENAVAFRSRNNSGAVAGSAESILERAHRSTARVHSTRCAAGRPSVSTIPDRTCLISSTNTASS